MAQEDPSQQVVERLEQVIAELQQLRRLIGTIFVVSIFIVVIPALLALGR